ncbi:MAG TPA: cytochrome c [Candidatus Acidoferrum sp.]|jgi:mono/diheme cytochrome c family protein|nr:cytochrome c [Candidatus Acidoferrum sp.]
MLKALLVGLIFGVVLTLGGLWWYFSSGRAPVATTDPPLPFERKLAHASLDAHLDRQPKSEPAVPADEKNFLAGADVYKQHCAVCHGLPEVAPTAISQGMFPKPPQLFDGVGVTDDPAWDTYWKAAYGIRLTGMPGFKGRLTDFQLWQVAQLLANADKVSPAVKAVLASPLGVPVTMTPTTTPSPTSVVPTK